MLLLFHILIDGNHAWITAAKQLVIKRFDHNISSFFSFILISIDSTINWFTSFSIQTVLQLIYFMIYLPILYFFIFAITRYMFASYGNDEKKTCKKLKAFHL